MKKTNGMIEVTYRGVIYEISEEDFEALKSGLIDWKDMFE